MLFLGGYNSVLENNNKDPEEKNNNEVPWEKSVTEVAGENLELY